jgi:hypothetical protein
MAGPSVSVRILGDTKDFSKSIADTGAQVDRTTARMHGAFSSVLGMVNRTGVLGPFGDALDSIDNTLGDLSKKGHDFSGAMIGVGGAVAGIGFGLSVLGSKDKAARQQLAASVEATGNAWSDYSDKVEEAIKHNERFGDTAATTENALQILTQATNSPQQALNLLGVATDLAAAKHEDLTTAATQLGKIYNGNTKLLKQFGINLDSSAAATKAADKATRDAAAAQKKLADAQQKLVDLQTIDAAKKKLTVTQTVRLHDAQLKVVTTTNDATAAQKKMNDAQAAALTATKNQASGVEQLGKKVYGQAAAQADTATGKLKGYATAVEDWAAAFGQKYANALQIAGQAVGVLGAGFRGAKGMIDRTKASLDAGAAGGEAAGKKVGIFTKTVKAIIPAAEAAGTSVLIFGTIVTAVVLAAVAYGYLLYRNWGIVWPQLKQWAKDVFDYIHYSWNNLIGDFKAIPGQIARIADGMWDGIANAFVDVINFIIHIWNGLNFKLPSFDHFGIHFGGQSIGVTNIPDVPHMAQGGLITRDGLIYAHAGEAITPAARTGPAVVINDAHFSSEVDVELFMRRTAWIIQTQRV